MQKLVQYIKRDHNGKLRFMDPYLCIKEAFDIIDYSKFLQKLLKNGVKENALERFKPYLTNKNHCIKLSGCLSQVGVILFGAPKGSFLEPLLLHLYINGLPLCCDQLNPYKFADDKNLLYEFK